MPLQLSFTASPSNKEAVMVKVKVLSTEHKFDVIKQHNDALSSSAMAKMLSISY